LFMGVIRIGDPRLFMFKPRIIPLWAGKRRVKVFKFSALRMDAGGPSLAKNN